MCIHLCILLTFAYLCVLLARGQPHPYHSVPRWSSAVSRTPHSLHRPLLISNPLSRLNSTCFLIFCFRGSYSNHTLLAGSYDKIPIKTPPMCFFKHCKNCDCCLVSNCQVTKIVMNSDFHFFRIVISVSNVTSL